MTDSQREPTDDEEAHDVLAAEEFAIPQPEQGVPHDTDPEAHDVLAAEEFAFPAPEEKSSIAERTGSLPWVAAAGAALLGALAALRGRRRRSRRR